MPLAHRKVHRYCGRRHGGHRLIASSIDLAPEDERTLVQRSDLAGDDLGAEVGSYLTFYPLPSGLLALARTTYDATADRTGAVRTETLLLEHAPLTDTWPVRDPFVALGALQPLTPVESKVELEAARRSDGPIALDPVIFDGESVPLASRLAPLEELPLEVLVALLSAHEGDLPFAVVGARDPERLVEALHLLLPLQGRPQHAFCTGALAPRDFTRAVVAQDKAADRFVARAARDRDLAVIDLARPQAWNVNEGELAGWVARKLKSGESSDVLALVERASEVSTFRAFADLALQLRWEDLSRSTSRTPEESVELANHLKRRGAPLAEVVACFREAVTKAGRERPEWAWNVLVLAWLPARLELETTNDPAESEMVRALVRASLAERKLQPVTELLEQGGERVAPGIRALVLSWARENAASLAGTLGAPLEAWLSRELAAEAARGENASAALHAFAAFAGGAPDEALLATALKGLGRVAPAEHGEAARHLTSFLLAAGKDSLWRSLVIALGPDRPALRRIVRGVPRRLQTAESLAPLVRVLPLGWPEVVRELAVGLAVAAKPARPTPPVEPTSDPDETGAFAAHAPASSPPTRSSTPVVSSAPATSSTTAPAVTPATPPGAKHDTLSADQTGAFAAPLVAAAVTGGAALDPESTGAIARAAIALAPPEKTERSDDAAADAERTGSFQRPLTGEARTPTDWSETPTARHAAYVAAAPAEHAPLYVEALEVLARELAPRIDGPQALRDHRHALAAIAHAGRRAGRPDLAQAPRARAVALAIARGGAPAIEGRAVARALAWGFREPLALIETARRIDPSAFGSAAESLLAVELALAAAADRVDPGIAGRLAAALSPGSFARASLAGLVALQLLVGKLPEGASLLDAAELALAEAEAGLPEELERALETDAARAGLSATVLARALAGRLERESKPEAAPWLEAAVRVARVLVRTRAEEAEKLSLLAIKVLEGVECPPEQLGRVLDAAGELGPFARGKWHDVRLALARRALAGLGTDASRDLAFAALARELPPLLEDEGAGGPASALASEKLGALLQAGKLDVAHAADLGSRALGLALAKAAQGGFSLKVQSGLEALALKSASEGARGRATLLVAIEHLRAIGDKELGARAGARIRAALGAVSLDGELKDALQGLESGKPRRAPQ